MSQAATATWSARQQQLLAAMGYRLYRRRPLEGVAIAPVKVGAVAGQSMWSAGMAPLARAVLTAAGREAGAPVEQVQLVWAVLALPPPESLRDPVAKRALWPRLRALRRDGSTP